MHELSIAKNIIDVVTNNLAEYPGARVDLIKVEIGIFSGVDPEALRFCFPLAAEGSSVDGAELLIDTVPLTVSCRECGNDHAISDSMQCPVCGSLNVTITSGRELAVSSVDLTLPEED